MKYLILNHKMNLEYKNIKKYIVDLTNIDINGNKLVVCPSDIYLTNFIDNGFIVGSQNSSSNKDGAYTGEVSALQLKSLGVKYSLVGHSERKKNFNENDQDINKKIRLLLLNKIKPILCVGETMIEKSTNTTKEVISQQLKESLSKINSKDISNIIIAYEPVWAVGSGKTPSSNEIEEIILYIKDLIYKNFKVKIRVLYGGSVNNSNIERINRIKGLDGYLLGSISLDLNKLQELITKM